ncbi:MAG: hypothetical protein KAR42_16175 [candidate division Zixibacteria bacterium]|nr:hypothetical protein [candidate division Zixibacteria bacterium]
MKLGDIYETLTRESLAKVIGINNKTIRLRIIAVKHKGDKHNLGYEYNNQSYPGSRKFVANITAPIPPEYQSWHWSNNVPNHSPPQPNPCPQPTTTGQVCQVQHRIGDLYLTIGEDFIAETVRINPTTIRIVACKYGTRLLGTTEPRNDAYPSKRKLVCGVGEVTPREYHCFYWDHLGGKQIDNQSDDLVNKQKARMNQVAAQTPNGHNWLYNEFKSQSPQPLCPPVATNTGCECGRDATGQGRHSSWCKKAWKNGDL